MLWSHIAAGGGNQCGAALVTDVHGDLGIGESEFRGAGDIEAAESVRGTYLTVDLAVKRPLKTSVSACLIASPRAGNVDYAQYFDQNVSAYKVYNYSLDVVPKVPLFFDYLALPKATEFAPEDAQASIRHTLGCNHHAAYYAAMLDYGAADWSQIPGVGQGNDACLLGKCQGT